MLICTRCYNNNVDCTLIDFSTGIWNIKCHRCGHEGRGIHYEDLDEIGKLKVREVNRTVRTKKEKCPNCGYTLKEIHFEEDE